MAKVTVVTATTGNPLLSKCIESVGRQTHTDVQHLVVIDGPERANAVMTNIINVRSEYRKKMTKVQLPYSIGKDRWNGHRIYGGSSFMAEGDFIMYLDDDNSIDPTHIEDCLKVIEAGNQWAFSFRKIQDKEGNILCEDNCESLGRWPSVMDQSDYFVDVNCYFLPIELAIHLAPLWYRKAREPGVPEVDRIMCHTLRRITPKYDSTFNYTVNYTAGNSQISVQPEFFKNGNAEMLRRYNGVLPWKK